MARVHVAAARASAGRGGHPCRRICNLSAGGSAEGAAGPDGHGAAQGERSDAFRRARVGGSVRDGVRRRRIPARGSLRRRVGCARVRHPRGSARGERRGGAPRIWGRAIRPGRPPRLTRVLRRREDRTRRPRDGTRVVVAAHRGTRARAHQARSRGGRARVARTPRPIAPAMATRGARRARRRG